MENIKDIFIVIGIISILKGMFYAGYFVKQQKYKGYLPKLMDKLSTVGFIGGFIIGGIFLYLGLT